MYSPSRTPFQTELELSITTVLEKSAVESVGGLFECMTDKGETFYVLADPCAVTTVGP